MCLDLSCDLHNRISNDQASIEENGSHRKCVNGPQSANLSNNIIESEDAVDWRVNVSGLISEDVRGSKGHVGILCEPLSDPNMVCCYID